MRRQRMQGGWNLAIKSILLQQTFYPSFIIVQDPARKNTFKLFNNDHYPCEVMIVGNQKVPWAIAAFSNASTFDFSQIFGK